VKFPREYADNSLVSRWSFVDLRMPALDLHMAQEKLTRAIQSHAQEALKSRQVARRLEALLPVRLKDVERHFRQIQKNEVVNRAPVAGAQRRALCDKAYLDFIQEYADIHGDAIARRIQYETHLMLFEARRSLRKAARSS